MSANNEFPLKIFVLNQNIKKKVSNASMSNDIPHQYGDQFDFFF